MDAEGHNDLGGALARRGRYAEAVAEFRKAAGLRPGYEEARKNLSDAEAALGSGRGSR